MIYFDFQTHSQSTEIAILMSMKLFNHFVTIQTASIASSVTQRIATHKSAEQEGNASSVVETIVSLQHSRMLFIATQAAMLESIKMDKLCEIVRAQLSLALTMQQTAWVVVMIFAMASHSR